MQLDLDKGLQSEAMQEGSVITRDQVWCFPMSHNFLCYFLTLLRGVEYVSHLLTSCVGGMKEAFFQGAAFQQSCCQSGGNLTLTFLLSGKISNNSLHGFYKWLCSIDSARN